MGIFSFISKVIPLVQNTLFKSITSALFSVITQTKHVHRKDGSPTNPMDIISGLMTNIPVFIEAVMAFVNGAGKNLTPQEKKGYIDQALYEFDMHTGTEGIEFLPLVSGDREEKCLDHFVEIIRLMAYEAAGIDEYIELPDESTIKTTRKTVKHKR